MSETDEPGQPVRGCVQRLGLPPSLAVFLETLRIRDSKASIEEVLREAMYDLAEAHGIHVPRQEVTEADRAKIAEQGQLDHGNVRSTMSKRVDSKRRGRVYVELVLFFNGDDKWPNRLLEKLDCKWPALILHAIEAYEERRSH